MSSGRTGGGKMKAAGAAAAAPAWKKPTGASLSAKAKKEYLKWKREQKRHNQNQADDDSDESGGDWGPEAAAEPRQPAAAGAPGAGGGRAGAAARRPAGVEQGQQPRRQQQQQQGQQARAGRAAAAAAASAREAPLPGNGDGEDEEEEQQEGADSGDDGCGDTRASAPAAPSRWGGGAAPAPRSQPPGGGGGGRAVPDDRPLSYVPMVELPPGDVPECVRAVCGSVGTDAAAMRLPRVREDEVGFTEEGRRLGMPKRPHWRGTVRNAEQLHRLEERSFQAWVDQMYASVDSPARISFFEPKLDFWRQLWRVLERSDVAIMIVDARNPLLHFSEALARHVLDEHGIPALLVLNKCDLVPAACVAAWRGFFEGRYPGLQVVASSASAAGGRGAAEAIMDAVLDCRVVRDGQRVKVSEVVRMSRDEVLAASKARNTHSKRDRPQLVAAATAAEEAPGGEADASGADAETGPESAADGGGVDEDGGGGGGWELKGNKAKKKAAVRRKRNQRMHAGGGGGGGGAGGVTGAGRGLGAGAAAGGAGARRAGGREDGRRAAAAAVTASAVPTHGPRGGRVGGTSSDADADEEVLSQRGSDEEQEQGRVRGDASAGGGDRETEDAGDEDEEVEENAGAETASETDNDNDNDNAAFEQLMDEEDEEGFLREEEDEEAAAAEEEEREEVEGEGAAAAAAAGRGKGQAVVGGGWGGHGSRGGRDRRGRSRPVVVCVVGEPNVGKSSTLNALLGAKRVAVSSHPGRTKHYQTHMMCPSLMLCDCPGLVFPRLDVSLHMQVLFGSYPIARCRDPYAVVRYLAERVWPRLHRTLGLKPVREDGDGDGAEGADGGGGGCRADRRDGAGGAARGCGEWRDEDWTPLALCEALAARHNWRSRRGGRLDVYRSANWILRSALAGRNGVSVAFLPPEGGVDGGGG